MADFQDWEPGLAGLRDVRPDLADWSAAAMEKAKETIAEHNVLQLPQGVVHGDFAEWNVHFTDDGEPAGVIDFDLTHRDWPRSSHSRASSGSTWSWPSCGRVCRPGQYDLEMIDSQLARTGTARP